MLLAVLKQGPSVLFAIQETQFEDRFFNGQQPSRCDRLCHAVPSASNQANLNQPEVLTGGILQRFCDRFFSTQVIFVFFSVSLQTSRLVTRRLGRFGGCEEQWRRCRLRRNRLRRYRDGGQGVGGISLQCSLEGELDWIRGFRCRKQHRSQR